MAGIGVVAGVRGFAFEVAAGAVLVDAVAADIGGAARVQSVAGAGHLADLDEPGACAAAVSEFLG